MINMSYNIEEKKKALKEELEKLKYEFRVELPKIIAEAREYGDLKENAEYHSARERQSFVKAKIGQVTAELAKLNEIDLSKISRESVDLGSTVTLVDMDDPDETMTLTFVSQNEVNPREGKISLSSPYGTALSGRKAGEDVVVEVPAGERHFFIKKLVTIHGDETEAEFKEE